MVTSDCPSESKIPLPVDERINTAVAKLVVHLSEQLESVVYYPHPFTGAGLLFVFSREVEFAPDLIAEVYLCIPSGVPLYCLRSDELFQLSMPGQFIDGMPNRLSDHPHLAYWVKHKGVVLHGCDIREQIALPSNPRDLLSNHIERCRFYLRNTRILYLLASRKYLDLIKELDKHFRHLMATALLLHDQWEVSAETAPAQFEQSFADSQLKQIWCEFRNLSDCAETPGEDACRQIAFEVVWLFESFIARLENYAQ